MAVLLPLAASAQQTFLQCDFSEGIPADFTLYDLDGSEPSIDMKNTGFATGIPWIARSQTRMATLQPAARHGTALPESLTTGWSRPP